MFGLFSSKAAFYTVMAQSAFGSARKEHRSASKSDAIDFAKYFARANPALHIWVLEETANSGKTVWDNSGR